MSARKIDLAARSARANRVIDTIRKYVPVVSDGLMSDDSLTTPELEELRAQLEELDA